MYIGRGENAAFGHDDAVGRDTPLEREGGVERDLEAAQIAVVDADERRVERQRPRQFGAVVHFNQHGQTKTQRVSFQIVQLGVVERGDDKQNRVGADGARFGDLPAVDDEVLADHRQVAGGTRGLQVGVGTLKVIDVGQH